jgi:hypothetical protein
VRKTNVVIWVVTVRGTFLRLACNVSICVRAGLPKPRLVPDNERIKDTKTLDYASTPLDANTLLATVGFRPVDRQPFFNCCSILILNNIVSCSKTNSILNDIVVSDFTSEPLAGE